MERSVHRARIVLTAYLAFAMVALILCAASLFWKALGELLVPLTGWTGLFVYLWTVFFALHALYQPNRTTFLLVVRVLGMITAIEACHTTYHAMMAWTGQPDFGNPYLIYHPARPLMTVVIPAAWATALWVFGRKLPAQPGGTVA
jgi:hypothetical protein